ncbi:chromosomal replication initiation protein [Candidatus Aerophobetes bacterium]|uniref:Chromosomal replication initiator protein DnaA n=1 Tax=Aerophobetes bacterium TaxID=2030807 RepID=A0A2A4YDV6_UNCAE|nr:MAG: chromosomal replication initiation protein [Candidatus Aerophobetes bacterium]
MKIWNDFLILLEKDLGKDTVDNWLRTFRITSFDACNLYLETKDTFQALWFEEHVRKKAERSLFNYNGRRVKVHIKSPKEKPQKQVQDQNEPVQRLAVETEPLNPNFTFENFITKSDNLFSLQVLSELCDSQKNSKKPSAYNPLFLYGKKGCGKTHLLHAISANFQKCGMKMCFLHAQSFTEHLVRAIKQSQMHEFRRLCRSQDALLIDNVEIFGCKNATQEEFFHTFNHFHTRGKPIVLTSSVPPKDLKEIEARLISRFEWGLNLPLKLLSSENHPVLLLKKLKLFDLKLTKEIQDYLLETFDSPLPLSEAIEALHLKRCIEPSSYRHFSTKSYVIGLTRSLLNKYIRDKITPDRILASVCRVFDQSKADLLGKSQTKQHVLPRKVAMYLMKKRIYLSYVKIGKYFSRDHSTVMSAVAGIEKELVKKNQELSSKITDLNKLLIQ